MRMEVVIAARLVLVTILALSVVPLLSAGTLDIHQLRMLVAKNNVTCIFVFGDSSVDPGNNNRLPTTFKGNFPPYGRDFLNGLPTGRFTDGRLATDFIAEAAGFTRAVPAFLDPKLKPEDLLHGISFASAASGYDDLTANLSNVLPVSKQLDYFKHYKIHLRQLVGVKRAEEIIRTAIFVLSMGTNDFIQNYYLETIRSKQFSVEEYQNYLISRMYEDIKEMHKLGARRLVVVGIPPLGCLPVVKMLMDQTTTSTCVEKYNKVSFSFNFKIQEKLHIVRRVLGIRSGYLDIYGIIADAVNNPKKYGFTETTKGCCGAGSLEIGVSCKGMTTCSDASKYVFWDAVHPTQRMYQIIANEGLQSVGRYVFS